MDDDRLPYSFPPGLTQEESWFVMLLHAAGLRLTPVRLEIFRRLFKDRALKPSQLGTTASIYRNLTALRQAGLIEESIISGKRRVNLTRKVSGRHTHYLICHRCEATMAFSSQLIEKELDKIVGKRSFTKVSHQLSITGLCPNCRPG